MKKIIALFLISALLLLGGCSGAKAPSFAVSGNLSGVVRVGETETKMTAGLENKTPVIVLKTKENAYDSKYEFFSESVKITYGDIVSDVEFSDLPEGNVPLVSYKIFEAVKTKNAVEWQKNESGDTYSFKGKISSAAFSGTVDKNGKILNFKVPVHKISFVAS